MKRKLPLFLAALLTMSLLCTSLASAIDSPSREGAEDDLVNIDELDVPLLEVPEVRIVVKADGAGIATVPENELLAAAESVEAGEVVRITVVALDGSRVVLPRAGIQAASQAGAELKVETPLGQLLMSASILNSYNGDITLVIEKEEDNPLFNGDVCLKVYLICGETVYYTWGGESITLYVPVTDDSFVLGSYYHVEQYNENGVKLERETPYVGQCVELDGEYWVVISNDSNYLGYFKTLPGEVTENVAVADPTVLLSPLSAGPAPAAQPLSVWDSVGNWFDSVANQFMRFLGL